MSKKNFKKMKKKLGFICIGIGAGIILVFVVPVWGFILAVGAALIYIGWYILDNKHFF